jgi:fluoride exporter
MTAALFLLAAAAGASMRFLATDQLNRDFPTGTFLVNIAACFAAGALSTLGPPWPSVAAVGGLGALSSWADTASEVAALARGGQGRQAWLFLMATMSTGILAAWAGLQIAA